MSGNMRGERGERGVQGPPGANGDMVDATRAGATAGATAGAAAGLSAVSTGMHELAQSTAGLRDAFAASNGRLVESLSRYRRLVHYLIAGLAALIVLAVVDVVLLVEVFDLSHTISAQTSPQVAAADQARLVQAEHLLIGCENNHVDRVVAVLSHRPVPARLSDCPVDSLP